MLVLNLTLWMNGTYIGRYTYMFAKLSLYLCKEIFFFFFHDGICYYLYPLMNLCVGFFLRCCCCFCCDGVKAKINDLWWLDREYVVVVDYKFHLFRTKKTNHYPKQTSFYQIYIFLCVIYVSSTCVYWIMYLAQYFSVVFFCNVLRICYTTLKSQYKDLLLNKNKSSIYKKNCIMHTLIWTESINFITTQCKKKKNLKSCIFFFLINFI